MNMKRQRLIVVIKNEKRNDEARGALLAGGKLKSICVEAKFKLATNLILYWYNHNREFT